MPSLHNIHKTVKLVSYLCPVQVCYQLFCIALYTWNEFVCVAFSMEFPPENRKVCCLRTLWVFCGTTMEVTENEEMSSLTGNCSSKRPNK